MRPEASASSFSLQLFPATAGIEIAVLNANEPSYPPLLCCRAMSCPELCSASCCGVAVDNISQHGAQDKVGQGL